MRTRVFVDRQMHQSKPLVWLTTPTTTSTNTFESFISSREYAAMIDIVTPKYRTLQNQGIIINNPMWREVMNYKAGTSDFVMNGMQGSTRIHSEFSLAVPFVGAVTPLLPDRQALELFFTSNFQDDMDLASNRAFANVEVSEAAALASLGELPETLNWMKSILTRGVNLTKMLRRRGGSIPYAIKAAIMAKPPGSVKKLAKSSARGSMKAKTDAVSVFANLWLEYRYAIRPLIFEMEQCIEALNARLKNTRQTARGKENNETITDNVRTSTTTWSSMIINRTYRVKTRKRTIFRAGVLFNIDDDINALFAIWGLDQPLQAAYELVSLSFILDWFFSVGDVIGAYAPKASLTPLSSWCTCRYVEETQVIPISATVSNRSGYQWDVPMITHGSASMALQRTWRKPVAERSLIPTFDLKLDLAKIVDLGTIGRSLLFGKPKH